MFIKRYHLLAVALLISLQTIFAQTPPATPPPKAEAKEIPSQEELEAKFKAMLTKATLSGRWAPIKDGKLGPEKEDKYHIVGVHKLSGSSWAVHAKMKYNDREFVIPLPVQVKFAGDTPMIIVDDLMMPGGNRKYSARVLFYNHTYAGAWSGGEHGGLLSGVITNEEASKGEKTE